MIGDTLSPQAQDFAPDLLTLQQSPPSGLPRIAVLLTTALVGSLVAWAAFARLDIVATAQGRLVPATFTKVVQPAEAGVVAAILVKDGDVVKAGQVLLRLDARLTNADAGSIDRETQMRQLTVRRIDAELSHTSLVVPDGFLPELVAQVRAQHAAHVRSFEDARAQEEAALSRGRADLAATQKSVDKLRETVPIYQEAAQKNEALAREGFVPALAADDRRREFIEKRQELRSQLDAVTGLSAALAQQQKKLDLVKSSYRTQLENERLETLAQLNRLTQEKDKSDVRVGQLQVRAPCDGIVKDVAVMAPGAVVPAGAQLMNIVPRGEALLAEVMLSNDDAGFVAVGQKVRLKIATYPFQKYGLLEGAMSLVAADATQVQGQPQQPLTYRGLVRLATQELTSPGGERLALSPGMLVAAEIHQGERTVLDYLLSPVRKVASEAARER